MNRAFCTLTSASLTERPGCGRIKAQYMHGMGLEIRRYPGGHGFRYGLSVPTVGACGSHSPTTKDVPITHWIPRLLLGQVLLPPQAKRHCSAGASWLRTAEIDPDRKARPVRPVPAAVGT